MLKTLIDIMERGWIPDSLVRAGIRNLSAQRLREFPQNIEARQEALQKYVQQLKAAPIAIATKEANEQHYELPPEFFTLALGKRRKYSACYWPSGVTTLDQSEEASLKQVSERARLQDGLDILELGCGWGSLTLWMAEKFPNAKITAVSNSAPQRLFIEGECQKRGFGNVKIITNDINVFEPKATFDRVVSIEMFEHVRNYDHLMSRVGSWIKPGGFLFVHIFVHKDVPYFFEVDGDDNWMGRYFFTGGQMPSKDLLLYFQGPLQIVDHWALNGEHYAKTSEGWLQNMDAHREEVMKILEKAYGSEAKKWFHRWRVFFMAVAELFAYAKGEEWIVAHHLFQRPA